MLIRESRKEHPRGGEREREREREREEDLQMICGTKGFFIPFSRATLKAPVFQ